jgi:hypothetical protein
MDNTMSTKNIAETISARMSAKLPASMINGHLREAVEDVKVKSRDKKLTFTIKATCDIKQDETIEFETWSEVSSTDKDTTEKVGETFDLRQATMDFE